MKKKKIYNYLIYLLSLLILFFLSANISFQVVMKGEMVSLPNLIGKTMNEAKQELAKKKLSLVQKGTQFSTKWPQGQIIFQEPPPGSKLKLNKKVKVILSAGSQLVVVPKLIGKNLQSINPILGEAGLKKGKISQAHTSKYAAGKIIAQQPLPLAKVPRNSSVSFLVSQGQREKKYVMPDLIGKPAARIIARLKEMDFKVEDIRYVYYPGLESGIIIKQFPPQGFRIQKRNLITLEVSK